ncbi:phosphinothricin acetyltransferase [Stackebrandtia albiflava]|uniref:Phosphinothricin acetyltransferase n=2 Tax=Stackebrandtia albiflava TaxID=406432 RepID=A0A562VDI4_9ACTN|nr:GNAT family N-acetyltransferase [Stackebrandtia albiflava]TWJ15877.1 phosphinothricin acetyltransferase [Stackebrandtia albiflava]
MHIRAMTHHDAPHVHAIHRHGIDTHNATFDTTPPTWDEFDATHHPRHRLVAHDDHTVLGWAAAAPVSHRHCYRGVVTDSVYIHPRAHGRGVGTHLLAALIRSCEDDGIWTIRAAVFPENTASIALHTRAGFRTLGTSHHLGRLNGTWRDVVTLERRSTRNGTD